MSIKILLLISFFQMTILFIMANPENPSQDLSKVSFLIFEKYKKTNGDRHKMNAVDQLNCVGDKSLCMTNLILKATCHNLGKKLGEKRKWRCEAPMDPDTEFKKIDVNCVEYFTDSIYEDVIVKDSCSLDYSLQKKRVKFTVMKIVTIASVAIAIISILCSLVYNNKLKNKIELLQIELNDLRSTNSTATRLPNATLNNQNFTSNQFIPPNNQFIPPNNQFNNQNNHQFASAPPPVYEENSKFAYSNTNYR